MKKLTFLLSVVAWLMTMPMMADDTYTENGVTYTKDGDIAKVTAASGASGDVVIKGNVEIGGNNYCVTVINTEAFQNNTNITKVTIPNDVTLLCEKAFQGCTGLTEIVFNEWEGKGGITELYQYMFDGCTNLTKVNVPGGVTKIHNQVFNNCSNLTTVSIPSTCTEIGSYAFFGCTDLSGIELPAVEKLNDHAFKGSGLASIYLPSTIKDLGTWTFEGCTALKYVKLPTSVSLIGQGVFYGCSGLEFITIPASVNHFGGNVFEGCTALRSFYYLGTSFPITFENGNIFFGIENGEDKRPKIYTKPGYDDDMQSSLNGKCDWLKPFVSDEIPYTPAKEYTTFCRDFDVDFSAATGLKAGVALSSTLDEGKLTFTMKSSVPAGTGVLLKGTAGATYTLKIAESAPAAVGGNLMKGVIYNTTIGQTDGGNTNFVLSDGTFKKVNSIGNTIPAGKAYLQLPTSTSSARDISFSFDDEPTGINMVQGIEQKDDSYYNLQGQRVSQPMKGLYIINGKKVVVK